MAALILKSHLKRMKRKMLNITLTVVVTLVLLVLFFRWFERANVWAPSRTFYATPEVVNLEYEEVFFETDDGVRLHGWHIPCATPVASLLFCHGNGGNLSYRTESLRQFHSLNLSVFIFDYRGYGKSAGRLSEEGTYRDAQAAYEWLARREPNLPTIVFGRSLGAAIAVDLATKVPAGALICESGFTSVPDVGEELFPILPVRKLGTIQYDALSKIESVKMPILVIHSQGDELIPCHHGQKLFERAPEPKKFLMIQGGHNDGYVFSESRYLTEIQAFLTQYISHHTRPKKI